MGSLMYRKHWYIRLASSIPSDPEVSQYTPGLEIISTRMTIDPRVTDDCCAFWKLKFGDFCFHPFIFQRNLLNKNDLLPVSRSMDIRAKSYVVFYSLLAEVDYGFMELVLQADFSAIVPRYGYNHGVFLRRSTHSVAYVVANQGFSFHNRQFSPAMFRVKVWHQLGLFWLFKRDGFELKAGCGRVEALYQSCTPGNLRGS